MATVYKYGLPVLLFLCKLASTAQIKAGLGVGLSINHLSASGGACVPVSAHTGLWAIPAVKIPLLPTKNAAPCLPWAMSFENASFRS